MPPAACRQTRTESESWGADSAPRCKPGSPPGSGSASAPALPARPGPGENVKRPPPPAFVRNPEVSRPAAVGAPGAGAGAGRRRRGRRRRTGILGRSALSGGRRAPGPGPGIAPKLDAGTRILLAIRVSLAPLSIAQARDTPGLRGGGGHDPGRLEVRLAKKYEIRRPYRALGGAPGSAGGAGRSKRGEEYVGGQSVVEPLPTRARPSRCRQLLCRRFRCSSSRRRSLRLNSAGGRGVRPLLRCHGQGCRRLMIYVPSLVSYG